MEDLNLVFVFPNTNLEEIGHSHCDVRLPYQGQGQKFINSYPRGS